MGRDAQPFRKGARGASPVLDAMQKGGKLHEPSEPEGTGQRATRGAAAPTGGRAPRTPRQHRSPRTGR